MLYDRDKVIFELLVHGRVLKVFVVVLFVVMSGEGVSGHVMACNVMSGHVMWGNKWPGPQPQKILE